MSRDRAAYMREYRARKKPLPENWEKTPQGVMEVAAEHILRLEADRRDCEEEVRHLKAELAKRPETSSALSELIKMRTKSRHQFNSRPFTPVPKK